MKLSECTQGKIVEVSKLYPQEDMWYEVGMVVGLGVMGTSYKYPVPKVHFPVKDVILDIRSSYLNLYEG